MNTIKGLVLISRFDFIEGKYGSEVYRAFLDKISTEEENYKRQPVVGANNYPEATLSRIDELMLSEFFNGEVINFRQVGEWNANSFMHSFFNLYVETKQPGEFLKQHQRLRQYLIGSGKMTVSENAASKTLSIYIDYGQEIPRSVCLSEQGFICRGMEMCGAKNLKINEKECAGLKPGFECIYEISYEM